MSEEEPPLPEEPPQIPRGKLWACLLVPPVLSGLLTVLLVFASSSTYGEEAMLVLPLGLVAILMCLSPFLDCLRVRYRGPSVTLLGFGYFFGQIILCLSIWFGTCLLILG